MTGILSGITGSGGSPSETSAKAGAAEYKAAQISIKEQKRQFDESQKRLQPWQKTGEQALKLQSSYAGLGGKADQTAAFNNYMASPNQTAYKQAGTDALDRNSVALQGIGNTQIRQALGEQAAGWASQDYENQYNRIAGLSNTGQATGNQISSLGQNKASQIGNLGMQAGTAMSDATITGQQGTTAQNQQVGSALLSVGMMF
jgi:hypothetical protein